MVEGQTAELQFREDGRQLFAGEGLGLAVGGPVVGLVGVAGQSCWNGMEKTLIGGEQSSKRKDRHAHSQI